MKIRERNCHNGVITLDIGDKENRFCIFNLIQMPGCCGTTVIFGFKEDGISWTLKRKDELFNLILDEVGTNNILFHDHADGDMSHVLGKLFAVVDNFFNPNSENSVKLYSFTKETEEECMERINEEEDGDYW